MRATTTLSLPYGTSQAGTLMIERDTFDEVINFARAAEKNEVCGFLLVRQLSPDVYQVINDSLLIPEQEVNPGYSETLPLGDVAQMDSEETYEDDPSVFRLLWHSHVHGSANFSSTDTATHQKMSTATLFDAMFFMVVNTRGQATANLEVYRPFRIGTQLRLVVLENTDEVDLSPYKQVLRDKCSVKLLRPTGQRYTFGDEDDENDEFEGATLFSSHETIHEL